MFSNLKSFVLVFSAILFLAVPAMAQSKRAAAKAGLVNVCPKIIAFNPSLHFYKNNKPIRASSAFAAPVIGYNRVMTLGYEAGKRGPLGSSGTMFASNGTALSSMRAYPCRSDHCGGRLVSSVMTATARRAAIKATRSPTGYVKISGTQCVQIPDIGKCYGNSVNKGRGPCAGTVQ